MSRTSTSTVAVRAMALSSILILLCSTPALINATGSWSVGKDFPINTFTENSVAVGTLAFFGGSSDLPAKRVDMYDSRTGNWTSFPNVFPDDTGMTLAAVGRKVIVAGTSPTVGTAIYSVDTGVWTYSAVGISASRQYVVSCSVGSKVLFADGQYGPSNTVVDMYDADTNTWSVVPVPGGLAPRENHTGNRAGPTRCVFAGGYPGVTRVDYYEFATNQYTTNPTALNVGRYNHAAASFARKLLVAGGRDSSNNYLNSVEIYDATFNTWTLRAAALAEGVHLAAAGVTSDSLFVYIAGGRSQTDTVATVNVYDTNTDAFSTTTPLTLARYGLFASNAGAQLLFIAGMDTVSALRSTVDVYTASYANYCAVEQCDAGTCVSQPATSNFRCDCYAGFTGPLCTSPVLSSSSAQPVPLSSTAVAAASTAAAAAGSTASVVPSSAGAAASTAAAATGSSDASTAVAGAGAGVTVQPIYSFAALLLAICYLVCS